MIKGEGKQNTPYCSV